MVSNGGEVLPAKSILPPNLFSRQIYSPSIFATLLNFNTKAKEERSGNLFFRHRPSSIVVMDFIFNGRVQFLIARLIILISLVQSSLVPHPSSSAKLFPVRWQHSTAIAFTETSRITRKLKQRLPTRMRIMSAQAQDLDDASAYHEFVSAAVDFNSVYSRNGVVTGESQKNYLHNDVSSHESHCFVFCPMSSNKICSRHRYKHSAAIYLQYSYPIERWQYYVSLACSSS